MLGMVAGVRASGVEAAWIDFGWYAIHKCDQPTLPLNTMQCTRIRPICPIKNPSLARAGVKKQKTKREKKKKNQKVTTA